MRAARWIRGAAAAPTSSASIRQRFRPLPLHPWQVLSISLDPLTRSSRAAAASSSPSSSSSSLASAATVAEQLSRLPSTALLYYGSKLGPRPLVILDHSLPLPARSAAAVTAEAKDGDVKGNTAAVLRALGQPDELVMQSARKYEPILEQLNWDHGVVYIPLHVSVPPPSKNRTSTSGDSERAAPGGEESLLELSCRQVVAVLDVLDIHWTHFLTYSYGTLVAARMAASRSVPHRLGSFLSLDTPLVTRAMVRNAALREELATAADDVNVPLREVAFAQEMLKEGQEEEPLPCPVVLLAEAALQTSEEGCRRSVGVDELVAAARSDREVYTRYLFHPEVGEKEGEGGAKKKVFARDGSVREETRHTPLHALAEMRHPFQLLVPSSGPPLSDVLTHREFFGLRRPAVIKAARSHAELFGYCFGKAEKPAGRREPSLAAAEESKDGKAPERTHQKDVADREVAAASGADGCVDHAGASSTPILAAGTAATKEVADVICTWLNRFEQDAVLKRRYEQAARDMLHVMASSTGTGGAAVVAADGKKAGKKKEKHKKG